ncbi:MAG: alanine--tRNA ligase [Candidatus Diapherotrites archaeon]|uniref:Alanine--tRNA ligase n=1 Tax=Candidatus Iainarchaeum sp. TaxID=3101447 RepID=A0A8T4LJT6_9ARCH|nr:alanine--tRNA ligase [Candidatus Diapherotrites archaeon]
MKPDKQVKEEFRKACQREPEKHYPVAKLRELGLSRGTCEKCGKNYWAVDATRKVCGDAACQGGFTFIGNSPAKKQFDYLEAWKAFEKHFVDLGYKSLPRKPVVARWREDVYWVGASVYGFQPYVVSGEIKPPARAVIIPQLSLRFNDIDNVGITGSHYVCFDMLGQLHFEKKQDYDMPRYLEEYFNWIHKGMGVPKEELILHEDAWAGGGTFGPCIEFFSRGCEMGNQVYMQYRATETGSEELDIKVLDMGQGHERIPWFTQGKSTSYETTFPTVVKKLKGLTGVKADEKLVQRFLPYSAYLNVDEVEDIGKTWAFVARQLGLEANALKGQILPLAALYSVAEHSRAALVALHDGALPSNVGGGYNLRVIIRRALDFIQRYGWKLDFAEAAAWHSAYLKPLYPELDEGIDEVQEILEAEEKRYAETRERAHQIIQKELGKGVSAEQLIEWYDSQGISPELVQEEAAKAGKEVRVPEDFFARVAERHEQAEQKTQTKKVQRVRLPEGLPETRVLYYNAWKTNEFSGKVLAAVGRMVVLDQTGFYPTSGGQVHDLGSLEGVPVVEAFKQDGKIVHVLAEEPAFRAGQAVTCKIDFERRKQLSQHHTGAHLLNGVCRLIFGSHCWQAGAAKTPEKARLDITHFEALSDEQLKEIEARANEFIKKGVRVEKLLVPREEAEERFGMRIYQGGFIPGKLLRIVKIGDLDVEACGGTHLDNTSEIECLKVLNASRIQDGVVRLNFVCGNAARMTGQGEAGALGEAARLLGCRPGQVPGRARELFEKWKAARKLEKKGGEAKKEWFELMSDEERGLEAGELLREAAVILSTQPEHVGKTVKRFLDDLAGWKKKGGAI